MTLADAQKCHHSPSLKILSARSNQPELDPLAAFGKQCSRGLSRKLSSCDSRVDYPIRTRL